MLSLFNDLSIKIKVIVIAVLGVSGFAAVLSQSISFSSDTSSKLEVIISEELPALQITSKLMENLSKLDRLHQNAAVDGDKETLREAKALAQFTKHELSTIKSQSRLVASRVASLADYFEKYSDDLENYTASLILDKIDEEVIFDVFVDIQQNRDLYEHALQSVAIALTTDLSKTLKEVQASGSDAVREALYFGSLLLLFMALISVWAIRHISGTIAHAVHAANDIAEGEWNTDIASSGDNEMHQLLIALTSMRDKLRQQYVENQQRDQLQRRLAALNDAVRGEMTVAQIGDGVLQCIARQSNIVVGVFYVFDGETLSLVSTHAFDRRKGIKNRFELGESLVGQCGQEKKRFVVEELPDGFMPVSSGTGSATPGRLLLLPLLLNNELKGVLELGSFSELRDDDFLFFDQSQESIAIAIESAQSRSQLASVLAKTQFQADALKAQQTELQDSNRELEAQAEVLLRSEEDLQEQQEELQVLNEELEQRAQILDQQKSEILQTNRELEQTAKEVQEKSKQLEQSSTYKSQFLSTMSHELRTPLNSILILSQNLMNNNEKNLSTKQKDHAKVINSSGSDLLFLINDILDLSKVEEGKLELIVEQVATREFANSLQMQFEHQATEKDIDFSITLSKDVPTVFFADEYRLSQILKNFVSNAMKFTQKGTVEIQISRPHRNFSPSRNELKAIETIIFKVIDSGIGIPKDKQALVFEAFQQVDGTTSRKFGGTGLGLTISKQLASLLKGEIQLYSEGENTGSTFTLIIPIGSAKDLSRPTDSTSDLSQGIDSNEPRTGSTPELTSETAFDKPPINENPSTQIDILSSSPHQRQFHNPFTEQNTTSTLSKDALSTLHTTLKNHHILMVDDDIKNLYSLTAALEEYDIKITTASTGQDAIKVIRQNKTIDLVLMDIMMPGMDGHEAIQQIRLMRSSQELPIIALTARAKKLDKKKCLEVGANDYLAKPININALKIMLGRQFTTQQKK